jgi:hypothetical protein
MASFTDVGDTVVIDVVDKGEPVAVAISGTYSMTIQLQREVGSKGSGAFEPVKEYSTANATVADTYYTEGFRERLRLIVLVDTSGTATATLTEGSKDKHTPIRDAVGNPLIEFPDGEVQIPAALTLDALGAANVAGLLTLSGSRTGPAPVQATAATLAVTQAAHAGRVVMLNRAAGIAVTLPDPSGTGDVYTFVVQTTFTGAASIAVAAATDTMTGTAILFADGGDTVVGFATAADSDTIDLLGTGNSTGGIAGQVIRITDVANNLFHVELVSDAAGTEATPFSANVS